MKTGKWFARAVSLTLLFTILLGSSALAGWQKDGTGWWYSYENGGYAKNTWFQENNEWYYFGNDGYMVTGWQKIGSWYHFDGSGKMDTGWLNDGGAWYYLGQTGAMVTGWQKIGSWYHFNGSGKMDTGWLNDGGIWYYLDQTGAMATGWLNDGGTWYYLDQTGAMVTGWRKIGSWYHFNGSGEMVTGWLKDSGIWYYLDQSGAMVTGWQKIDGAWYYFDASGRMYTNAYIDKKYFVDANGRWDGVTQSDVPAMISGTVSESDAEDPDSNAKTLTFHQNGWYVARMEVQVWDKSKEDFKWIYSDSCTRGQKTTLSIDPDLYEINRVGYQIWFFGWDNDYMNVPWANTDFATDFTLSGYGDYPELTWQ